MRTGLLFMLLSLACAAQNLRVYAIDVEGGKSTLYVSPSGQSMLVDTGYDGNNGRDADRIVAAARDAGVKQIDYLVITHYHGDHMGGVAQLAARMPIRNFVDHGKNFETVKDIAALYNTYVGLREKGNRIVVKAGDRIPIEGLQVEVVTASGVPVAKALAGGGGPNPLCKSYRPIAPDDGENAHSIGLVVTLGRFRMSDLGDLYWNQEAGLACPNNLIGTVDVYMTTHHAKKTSGAPALVQAMRPRAAIMNNGPVSGGSEPHWETIHESPSHPDIWQLHFATKNEKPFNAPEPFIANMKEEGCAGNWILLTAQPGGAFTIINSRNAKEQRYPALP
jgi:beta-lactamase superfamily II metal-dependent hydrolase